MITDDTQPADFANGHAGSAVSCEEFANSLYDRYTEIGDMALLDEILDLEREALRLRPEGDPDRAVSCGNLALTLRARFDQTGQPALLDEALELEREALRLRPEGHMDRADSCANLAITLTRFFEQTGHTALLDEALELGREALSLRPEGHSDRADLCANLAVTLNTCFKQTGHTTLLDEALEFEREAMRLRPGGHPNRADSCINLAVTLKTRFRQTGHSTLLDEALELEREALHLRPEGHPNRAHSCGSLAKTLKTRFEQTGHTALLDEALELEREALSLRPEGHPDRAFSCGQLASTLGRFFEQTGHTALLDEVFELQREALRLRPEGHLRRSNSCVNLAVALKLRFDQNGHTVLLEEALELEREALRLRPEGHPRHAFLCANLAATLERRFNQTGDTALLDEARSYCTHAIKESAKSPEDHVRLRLALAHILCLATYPSGNPSTAVAFLLEIAQNPAGMIPVFYEIPYVLRMCVRAVVSDEDHAYLLAVYQALIDMLPEMGSAVLPKPLRVRRWSKAGNLPLEAFLQAMKVNGRATGLELLEQGRAVLWSQALAFQGTHLQGLPNERKTQLQTLLQSMNIAVDHGDTLHSDSAVRDRIHAAYTQLQQLLTEIRASPGLGRFMRGPLYSELLQVASKNPVIVVAASEATCHALVISSPSAPPTHLVLNQIAATDLDVLGHDIRGLDLNVRAMSGLAVATEERGICIDRKCAGTTVQKLHQALRSLWTDIVKPILECLGLRVCVLT
jgi:tetratricopeptide (TPR) repeat protein